MRNKFSKIKHFLPKFGQNISILWPNPPRFYTNCTNKAKNLRKFVQLGCPDPTPAMYLMNIEGMLYNQAAVPLNVVKDMDHREYNVHNSYYYLPPDPKNTVKITNI